MENIIDKLNRDVRNAASTLNHQEARYLVDLYYQMQHNRIVSNNQQRILNESDEKEPHETIAFFGVQYEKVENEIKSVLKKYVESQPIGMWMLSITGIGPVIAAGMIANIDIKKCQTAGAIWKFAGLDPTVEWKKGQKRPWNADLKTLCWKLGQSFLKVQSNSNAFYSRLYLERKEYETEKNEKGDYAEQAKEKLEKFKIGKTTEAYKAYSVGKLPIQHIRARALRWTVKIFLSHLFEVWYELDRGEKPPKPFAIAQLGHAHMIEAPNRP